MKVALPAAPNIFNPLVSTCFLLVVDWESWWLSLNILTDAFRDNVDSFNKIPCRHQKTSQHHTGWWGTLTIEWEVPSLLLFAPSKINVKIFSRVVGVVRGMDKYDRWTLFLVSELAVTERKLRSQQRSFLINNKHNVTVTLGFVVYDDRSSFFFKEAALLG